MAQFMVHTWMSNHTLIHRPQDVKESGILSVTSQIPVTSSICGRSPQAFIRRVISSTSRLVRLLQLLLGRLDEGDDLVLRRGRGQEAVLRQLLSRPTLVHVHLEKIFLKFVKIIFFSNVLLTSRQRSRKSWKGRERSSLPSILGFPSWAISQSALRGFSCR